MIGFLEQDMQEDCNVRWACDLADYFVLWFNLEDAADEHCRVGQVYCSTNASLPGLSRRTNANRQDPVYHPPKFNGVYMRLEDLNWMDVEKYLQQEDRLMLVTGSTEQHAYLSLLTDIKIPLALADAASQATGVLVAPPLNFGVSPYFLAYPGTLSLRATTLCSAVEDIIRSAYAHGFKRILVVNGHGGNGPARSHLQEVNNTLPDLRLNWYDWWLSSSVEAISMKHNLKPSHANWLEAFSFTMVGEMPDGTKTPPTVPSSILDAKTARRVYGDGSFGGAYRASEDVMQEMFAACVQDVLQLLKFATSD